jgi:2-methylcitrate dehydratase PrpD
MLTETLARFVTETRSTDIPKDVLDGARSALIDTVGVALAGTLEPAGEIALRWVQESGGKPQASCWARTSAPRRPKPHSRTASAPTRSISMTVFRSLEDIDCHPA